MKKLLILLFIISISMLGLAQNELPKTDVNINEVAVSPPVFMGIDINYLADDMNPDRLMRRYLERNVEFPAEAVRCHKQGTEVIQFDVTASGEITNMKIINSICPEIDNEVMRVLASTSGMWKPGQNNNTPVRMTKEFSMPFVLQDFPYGRYENVNQLFTAIARNHFKVGSKKLFIKQKPKKALKAYNQGIKYRPNDPALLINRGLCRHELGDKEGAIRDWQRAISFGSEVDLLQYAYGAEDFQAYAELLKVLNKE